jgi:hypothetical protein
MINVNENNKMNPEDLKEFKENKDNMKPIIELDEKKIMPLYMFLGNMIFETPIGDATIDFMASILHNKETQKLEIRGRLRFQDTGRKVIINGPTNLNPDNFNYEIAKKEIKRIYEKQLALIPLKESEPPFELSFDLNESIDSIIEKMNNSNKFNIGTIPLK